MQKKRRRIYAERRSDAESSCRLVPVGLLYMDRAACSASCGIRAAGPAGGPGRRDVASVPHNSVRTEPDIRGGCAGRRMVLRRGVLYGRKEPAARSRARISQVGKCTYCQPALRGKERRGKQDTHGRRIHRHGREKARKEPQRHRCGRVRIREDQIFLPAEHS